jgi:hypothetical protein
MLSLSAENIERLEKDVEYINNLLQKLGYDSPFPFPPKPTNTGSLNDRLRTTHILLQLLNARLKDSAFRTEIEHRIMLLEGECEKLNEKSAKLIGKLEMLEAENRRLASERAHFEDLLEKVSKEIDTANNSAFKSKQLLLQKEKHFLVRSPFFNILLG